MNKELYYQALKNICSLFSNEEIVFGEGNIYSKIMLIGEAPGVTEVEKGHCFVGKAGENLNEFLEILEINREDLYITNAVKFRPTKLSKYNNVINRTPNEDEIRRYMYYLYSEIRLVEPNVIVTLGAVALKAVLGDFTVSIQRLHGKYISCGGTYIFPLFHPASIIYNKDLRDTYINDLYSLKNFLCKRGEYHAR